MSLKRSFAILAFATGAAILGAACSSSSNGAQPFGDDTNHDASTVDATDEVISIVPDASNAESSILDGGGVLNDAKPDVDAMSCVPDAGGPGPVHRTCISYGNDQNECDGHHDIAGFPANGTNGNGFDDNCNGLVDEGCTCTAIGTTKDCYLVPASQTQNGVPVGWCTQNAKGTVDCVKIAGDVGAHWSGQCRGAQAPFPDDICAPGDFDCDGKEQNSRAQDCTCKPGTIQCPTMPLDTVPYPPPANLPLKVDATSWFSQPNDVMNAMNWKWTLRGGDCDNILPHPTFGIYPTQDGTGAPVGTQVDTLGATMKEHGIIATSPSVTTSLYPAFALSGDYVLQGEFDLYNVHHTCTVKIQVRAPGIRAEACWDTEDNGTNHADLDLHVAKVNGFSQCATSHGWSDTCSREDCYYANCKDTSFGTKPAWYSDSPASACVGWGSAAMGQACGNPRLDRDLISCDRTVTNPNDVASSGQFCGPENINIDAPGDGDKFAIAVKYYGGTPPSKTHVNVYCNGVRVVSTGYNPVTGNNYPQLLQMGSNTTGDMWKVGFVTAHVNGNMLSCDVATTQSQLPHMTTDGSNAYCVDNTNLDTTDSTKFLTPGGLQPLDANALCFH